MGLQRQNNQHCMVSAAKQAISIKLAVTVGHVLRDLDLQTFICLVRLVSSSLFSPCVQYFRASIPPAVRSTLLGQMDIESLTCAYIWVRALHMKGGQAQQGLGPYSCRDCKLLGY